MPRIAPGAAAPPTSEQLNQDPVAEPTVAEMKALHAEADQADYIQRQVDEQNAEGQQADVTDEVAPDPDQPISDNKPAASGPPADYKITVEPDPAHAGWFLSSDNLTSEQILALTPTQKGARTKALKKAAEDAKTEADKPTGAPTLPVGGAGGLAGSVPVVGEPSLPGLSDVGEYVSIGYYGKEGSGKTTDALSMANNGLIVLVNAEAGAKAKALRARGVKVDNIRIWPDLEKGETFDFDSLEKLYFKMRSDLTKNPQAWYGMVWDSLTEVSYKFVANAKMDNMTTQQAKGKTVDRWFMDRSFYGVSTSQIQELIRRFRDLPMHFALCALERRDTDDDGKVGYGPAVNPALATDVPGFVDVLVHCEVQEIGGGSERGSGDDMFVGWTRVHGKYRGKDRYGVLPKMMPDPTFDRIEQYINGDLSKENDQVFLAARARAKGEPAPTPEPDGHQPEEANADAQS